MGLRFREKREFLGEKKEVFYQERSKRNEPDFALDLFKENVSRWIKDLSRFCRTLNLKSMCCREFVDGKIPRWIKNLSSRQKLSR